MLKDTHRETFGRRTHILRSAILITATSLGLATVTGCQTEEVNPFEPRRMGQAQRDASKNQRTAELGELASQYRPWVPRRRVGTTQPTTTATTQGIGGITTGAEPEVLITLEEVIRRTVVNNLEVRVAGFGPGIEATRILEAQARFDPTFFTNVSVERTSRQTAGSPFSTPTGNPLNPFDSTILTAQESTVYTLQSGVRQVLESGGQIEFGPRWRSTDTNPSSSLQDPFREADLILQLTQPLLRDFGGVVNRARIDIARNNVRVSVLEFQKTVEEQIAQVEQSYWQLLQAQRDVATATRLIDRSELTTNNIANRFQAGTDASRLQLGQSQAELENRRAILIRARARVRDLSDQIKQIMHDPELPIAGPEVLVAESTPLLAPVRFDLDEQVDSALMYRLELSQQQLQVDNSSITLEAAKNNLLPQLNFVGTLNPSGGDGRIDTATSALFEFNNISYSAGLQFEMPLGNREARSIYKRTIDQRQQGIQQLASLQSRVIEDVRRNFREVETSWGELQNYRQVRLSREQVVRAAEASQETNAPTPDFTDRLLAYQAQLAQSEQDESAAIARYNVAIALLERSKGTLLRYNNITLGERGLNRRIPVRIVPK